MTSNDYGITKKTSLYLPEEWLDWLREMSEIRRRSMQSIIFEALAQWRERQIEEIKAKRGKLDEMFAHDFKPEDDI